MRTTITKEIEVITCDICGKESDIITNCRVCGKDICNNCRMWDQCGECWEDNYSFATINKEAFNTINHESKEKWRDLLSRFQGKRVKIIIEEFPEHEELKLKHDIKRYKEGSDEFRSSETMEWLGWFKK